MRLVFILLHLPTHKQTNTLSTVFPRLFTDIMKGDGKAV